MSKKEEGEQEEIYDGVIIIMYIFMFLIVFYLVKCD